MLEVVSIKAVSLDKKSCKFDAIEMIDRSDNGGSMIVS